MSYRDSYHNYTEETVIANEAYCGAAGAWALAEEQEAAQQAMFESVIGMDFDEIANEQGTLSESALEALNEASAKDIVSRIIEAIQKFGEAIKGILTNLIKKFQALFTTDGKKLVKDHEKRINEKLNKQLLSKVKYKYAEFTAPTVKVMDALDKAGSIGSKIKTKLSSAQLNKSTAGSDSDKSDSAIKPYTSDEISELKDSFLSQFTSGSTTVKDFKKDFMETCFGDADEKEGYDSSMHTKVKEVLTGHKTLMDGLKKEQSSTDKTIKNWKTEATKLQSDLNKAAKGENYSTSHKNAAALVGQVQQLLTAASTVTGMAYTAISDAYKKDYAQCRAIWIKMVGTNGKNPEKTNESAVLEAAVVESSNFEVDQVWEEA